MIPSTRTLLISGVYTLPMTISILINITYSDVNFFLPNDLFLNELASYCLGKVSWYAAIVIFRMDNGGI